MLKIALNSTKLGQAHAHKSLVGTQSLWLCMRSVYELRKLESLGRKQRSMKVKLDLALSNYHSIINKLNKRSYLKGILDGRT